MKLLVYKEQSTAFIQKHLSLFVFLVAGVLSQINLELKLKITPAWFNGILDQNHALLLDFNYTNNEQSRLFQFYIPELFVKLFGVSVIDAYIFQRFFFTTFTFFLFFFFAKKWLNNIGALVCMVLMAVIMPITYRGHLQESASLMSLTFLLALWAIRDQKTIWYVLVLMIGGINNETMLFLPAVYFFVNFDIAQENKIKHFFQLGIKTVLLALPAFIVVGIIRYINIDRPHLGGAWHWEENLSNLDILFNVYHIFWIIPFILFRKNPVFLQRALLTLPLFIIPHLITGVISETRQMIPLSFILLPAVVLFVLEIKEFVIQKVKL